MAWGSIVAGLVAHPLTYIRLKRGWTLQDVAQVVQRRSGLNMAAWRQKVYRWERGVRPEMAAQHALAAELGIADATVDAQPWPGWLLLVDGAERTDAAWSPQVAERILRDCLASAASDSRGFPVLTPHALLGIAAAWSNAAIIPVQVRRGHAGELVGAEVADWLRARLALLWRLDDLLGGGRCAELATADLALVVDLIAHARTNSRQSKQWFEIATGLARFAGWVAFDHGRHAAAQRYWHAAVRTAHAGGTVALGGYVLSNLALQAIYAGDSATALQLLDAAARRVDPGQHAVHAMLDTWRFRALAGRGEGRSAARMLQRADRHWERRAPRDDPPWIYWMVEPSLTAEAGTGFLRLRSPGQAERLLRSGMEQLEPRAHRERALYLIRIAEALRATGRADEAVHHLRDAAALAREVVSNRLHDQLAVAVRRLPAGLGGTSELLHAVRLASASQGSP